MSDKNNDTSREDTFDELDEVMDDLSVDDEGESLMGMSEEEEEVMEVFESALDEVSGEILQIPADVWQSVYDVSDMLFVAEASEDARQFSVRTLPNNSYLFEWFENELRVRVSMDSPFEVEPMIRERFEASDCDTIVYDGWGAVESYDTPEEVANAVKEHFQKSKVLALIPDDDDPDDYVTEITYEEDREFSVNHWVMEYDQPDNMSRYIIDMVGQYGDAVTVDVGWSIPRLCAFAESLTEITETEFEETEAYYEAKMEKYE